MVARGVRRSWETEHSRAGGAYIVTKDNFGLLPARWLAWPC